MKDEYGLTPMQRRFADLLISGMTEIQAYKAAGYSARHAHSNACRLARMPEVDAYRKTHSGPEIDARILTNTELLAFWSANVRDVSLSMVERRENSRLLANSKGMFKTKVEVDADVDYIDVLAKARARRVPNHAAIEAGLSEMSTEDTTDEEKG